MEAVLLQGTQLGQQEYEFQPLHSQMPSPNHSELWESAARHREEQIHLDPLAPLP